MSSIQRVTVSLPTELVERLQMSVRDGAYASTDEAVCDALEEWAAHREPDDLEELRAAIRLGQQGPGVSPEDVRAAAMAAIDAHRRR